jgi:hypothetical protein
MNVLFDCEYFDRLLGDTSGLTCKAGEHAC